MKEDQVQQIAEQFPATAEEDSNTIKEDLTLEYVDQFRQQYIHLFPQRPSLLLSPKNEHHMHKFICTYIRPTELPYHELFQLEELAKFISNYIKFEPLSSPNLIPEYIASPYITLKTQKGDCFELALLLECFLLGIGYDAYCVYGFAKKSVALNDQSVKLCPFVIEPEEITKDTPSAFYKPTKYKLKKRANLVSTFDNQAVDMPEDIPSEAVASETPVSTQSENGEEQEEIFIHSWILILPGTRGVTNPFFVEPTTGEVKQISDSDYVSVESVWNNENYWVNMQTDIPLSKTSFKLKDLRCWEYIFITEKDPNNDEDSEMEDPLYSQAVDSGEFDNDVLDVPKFWIRKLKISKPEYESRYPNQNKSVEYKNASVELYAEYFRKDLMTQKIILYTDETKSQIKEIHMHFARRKDLLRRRSIYYITNSDGTQYERLHEWFDPCRRIEVLISNPEGGSEGGDFKRETELAVEGLKEYIEEQGIKKEYRFYSESRLDGLSCRMELYTSPQQMTYPRKVMDHFFNRVDRVIYRSVTYGLDFTSNPTKPNIIKRKMCEKFSRDKNYEADKDVMKRTFFLLEQRIKLEYHYDVGKITRSYREYQKDKVQIVVVNPLAEKIQPIETVEEYKQLLQAERECDRAIKYTEEEIKKVKRARKEEEANPRSTTTIYDTIRNRPTPEQLLEMEMKEKMLREQRERRDPIRKYLPPSGQVTTQQEAQEIFDKVLEELKERLNVRAKIIQDRLTAEMKALNQRKIQFNKNQGETDQKMEDEYLDFVDEAQFRISILNQRKEDMLVYAWRKYYDARQQLLEDPRLKSFLHHIPKNIANNKTPTTSSFELNSLK